MWPGYAWATANPKLHSTQVKVVCRSQYVLICWVWTQGRGRQGVKIRPTLTARYGRSARSARGRRHYDDVTGD
jgi:hypothetical protein